MSMVELEEIVGVILQRELTALVVYVLWVLVWVLVMTSLTSLPLKAMPLKVGVVVEE